MADSRPPAGGPVAEATVVLVTVPSAEVAERLARGLVEAGLAACVNVIPGLRSIYRWEGRVEASSELLLLVKCRREAYPAVEAYLLGHHPYDLPECLALPVHDGSRAYLDWLLDPDKRS